MSISSHPSGELLIDHVRGRLPLAPGLTVAAHTELCSACRRTSGILEDMAGQALAGLPEVPLSPDALQSVLARLRTEVRSPAPRARIERMDVDVPTAAAAIGFENWRWLAPGINVADSKAASEEGWRTFLLRVRPGGALPAHGHDGDELVCVLQGGFTDGERWFWEGDFAEARGDEPHRLIAADGQPCICLVSTQAPLKWRGWTRFLQPFIRI